MSATTNSLWPQGPMIVPFPESSGNLSNPNVVGFHLCSSNTKTPKTPEWREVTNKWRREQLERARLRLKYRSVFRQLLTLPRFTSVQNTTSPPTSLLSTPTTNTTASFTSFQADMLTKCISKLQGRQPRPQLARRSMRLLLRTPSQTTTPTRKTVTPIKKTTKMPRKYREVAKMPRGWAHIIVEEGEEEVEEVWQKQKEVLSGCTTPGTSGV